MKRPKSKQDPHVHCHCGQQWLQDPALSVACPKCGVSVGQRCRLAGQLIETHQARDELALTEGFMQPCTLEPGNPYYPARIHKQMYYFSEDMGLWVGRSFIATPCPNCGWCSLIHLQDHLVCIDCDGQWNPSDIQLMTARLPAHTDTGQMRLF